MPLPGGVEARTLLSHVGPAVWVAADGTVVAANAAGHGLAALLTGEVPATGLHQTLTEALGHARPMVRTVRLPPEVGGELTEVWVLPSADGRHAALLARDPGLNEALSLALRESRARFKDLVGLSSDFAWETGPDGRLVYVSPAGALGHAAAALLGADPGVLLEPAEPAVARAVFHTRDTIRDAEVWVRDAAGRAACLSVSAMPLGDRGGIWCGARGLARDVTIWHDRERVAARARNRERLRIHLARAFRGEPDAEAALVRAAHDLARGLEASGCLILRSDTPKSRQDLLASLSAPTTRSLVVAGHAGPDDAAVLRAALPATLPEVSRAWTGRTDDRAVVCVATDHRGRRNGCLALSRPLGAGPWETDDIALAQDVAMHIGVTTEQILRFEAVLDISRTDPLTGAFNRRAFMEDLDRRLTRMWRSGGSGALLFVDLDNFKPVNDMRGHAVGDQVLVTLADLLRGHTRPTDIVARLGGDEFAIWLEDADAPAACAKARDFLASTLGLHVLSAGADLPLGMSIGIAVCDGSRPETLSDLTARADGAMYAAKHGGKGAFSMAPPAPPPSPPPPPEPPGPEPAGQEPTP